MAGFRIAEGFIEVTVDDSQVTPGVQRALQTAAVQSRQTAQNAGQHIGQHLAAGIRDGSQQGVRQAGQRGGDDFSEGFTRSASSGLKAGLVGVAVGAGAVFMKGFSDAVEQGNITSRLQVQLGATPKEAKKYGDAAGYLYTHGITDSFEEGADAIKNVMQQGLLPPGATNAQIASITGKVTDLSKTFDMDLGGATNAVSNMLKTGLAKNAKEALDILTRGAQTGADKAGDLADTFNEYSVQFQKMGLTGATSMGLISQGLRAGARDADLVADSIKEFSIRAVDGSKTTADGFKSLGLNADDMAARIGKGGKSSAQALDLTLDKLRSIKDPVERSRIAVELFGTQAEDMGKALYALDPSKAVDTLGKVGGAADKMGKTLHSGPSYQITLFKRTLEQGVTNFIGTYVIPVLTNLGNFLQTTLSPAFTTIKKAVGGFIDSMGGMPAIMGTITGVLTNLGKIALAALVPILKGLADSARKNLVPALKDVWSLLKTNLLPLLEGMTPIVKAVATAIGAAILPVMNALMVAIKGVVGFIKQWQNVFVPLAAGIAAFTLVLNAQKIAIAAWSLVTKGAGVVTRAWAVAQGIFNAVMEANPIVLVVAALVGLAAALVVAYKKSETFRNIVNGAWSAIKTGLSVAWEYIKKVFGWMKDLFLNFTGPGLLIKHWDTVKNGTKAAFDWVKQKISDVLSFLKNLFLNFTGPGLIIKHWDTIKSATGAAWDWVKKRITDALAAVKTTINNGMTAVKTVWNTVWTAIRDFFTTRWNNIKSNVTLAWAWLKDSFSKLKTAVTKTWTDTWNAIRDFFTTRWSNLKTNVTNAWSWLKESFSKLKTAVVKTWSEAWTSIRDWFTTRWNNIKSNVSAAWTWLKSSFSSLKTSVTGTWSSTWTSIRDKASDLWAKIKSGVNSFKTAIVGAFNAAKDGIGIAWNKLSSIAKKPVNFIIGTVYTKGIKALWDKVAKWVGLGALPAAPKLLAAGGTVGPEPGEYSTPTAIVGEGNPNYPEYVIPTDPKHRRRALALYQKAGTQLMDAGGILGDVWDATGGKVVSAAGNAASSIGGWIKDKVKDLAEGALEPFFKAGMKIVNGFLNKIPGANTGFGKLMKAVPAKVASGILGFLKGKDDEASGGADVAGALKWARTQAGKPYQWGGAGNPSWDCCLIGTVRIYGPNGATPIQDVRAGDEVYAYVDGRLTPQTVTAAWQSKTQQVFKVRTRNRAVVASANHPFMRLVQVAPSRPMTGGRRGERIPAQFDVEWARLDELRRGDLLVQPRAMRTVSVEQPTLPDGTEVTLDVAWLLGLFVGDGYLTNNTIRICVYDDNSVRAQQVFRSLGVNSFTSEKHGVVASSKPMVQTLDAMGVRRPGPDKRVPHAVWTWNEELQQAFLDGYCAADGHRPADPAKHGDRTYASASRELLEDVRALHMMLGQPVSNITTNHRTKPITIKGVEVKNARPLHSFTVWPGVGRGEVVFRRNPGLAAWLDAGDFTVAKVLEVTDEGIQDTYDLEVAGAHNFVADGVVVHNSGFMGGIQKKIDGKDPRGRIWSTFSFQGSHAPAGWVRHLKAPFMIGVTNAGKGHTAGTLGGVNVESSGGYGVRVGGGARGYNNSLFQDWYGYKPSKGGGDWSAKGTGVARWRPNVIAELKHIGQSTGWQDTVLRRMNQESGGDPNVVNKWDSNWKAGHPSVGLMQVIRGTFAAYAGSHKRTGPFKYGVSVNPNANIHAGLNYAQHQYGSLSALNRPGGYDSGGWLPPGATLAINKTGKPEAVLTNEEAVAFRRMVQNPDQLGGITVNVAWSSLATPSQDELQKVAKAIAKPVREEIRKVERAYR